MCTKCANPECSAAFNYRQGRIFRFPRRPEPGEAPLTSNSIMHFWLCNPCSALYNLEYLSGRSALVTHRFKHPADHPPKRRNIRAKPRAKTAVARGIT